MISPEQEKKLINLALKARENAYAPYSGYKVGAAALAASGRYYKGCNIENAALTTTTHAEVNAVNAAVGAGERRFIALAVATDNRIPPFPCAICRQTIAEFDQGEMVIIAVNLKKKVRKKSFSELYPEIFGARQLGIVPAEY